MQGSSKKHDLSPGDSQSQLPSKKLRMENPDNETSGLSGNSFNNSKNYLSRQSLSFNDSTSSMEKTYGSFRNRSSLSKPLGHVEKQASERFGPYSMRPSRRQSTPMIIRAKRQIQEDTDPHVTTTAQKIIETLARMSTPVANAQKVPIDTIKPLKPSFASLRRSIDYGGPPILRSPLAQSSAKIVSSPILSNSITLRSIPKLVDSATNTEHNVTFLEMGTYDDNEKHTGGGKIRRNTNRIHAAPLKKPSTSNSLGTPNNINEKNNYNFGSSWTAEEVIEAYAVRKEENKQSEPSENENKIAANNSDKGPKAEPEPSKKTWNCPTCCVPNKEEAATCVCCSEKNPNMPIGNQSKATPKTPVLSTSTVPKTNLSSPLTASLTPTKKKRWNCPVCMVPNEDSSSACVCCNEKNPNVKVEDSASAAAAPMNVPAPTFKFGVTATTSASNSTFSTFTFGAPTASTPTTKKPESESTANTTAKKWNCPTCMVPNSENANSCVCCGEKNPSSATETLSSAAPASSALPSSPFTFEFKAPKGPSTTSSSTSVTTSTEATTIQTSIAIPSTSVEKLPSSESIKPVFGIKAEKSTENVNKEQTNIFAGFKFSALATPATAEPSVPIAVPVETQIELWMCDICPARNSESASHCIACGAKKPIKLSKEPPKKFSFAPFAGGRSSIQTTSQTLQPPKTSIFGGSSTPVIASPGPGESPKQKRKHSDDVDAGFQYTPPEPKLKMKAPSEAVVVQPTEIKTGSFLEAMKPQQSNNVFGASSNTLVSPISISTPVTTVTSTPAPFVFGSTLSTPTSTAPPPFQFGSTLPSANSTFTFGSNTTTSKPSGPVFGTPSVPIVSSTSMPQPSVIPNQPAAPSFNMTPNLNFGIPSVPGLSATNSTPAPLFQFQANSTPSDGNSGGPRKIRKAMRRMK